MKAKATAILLASVLASPLAMASISRADGGALELEAEVEFFQSSKLVGGVLTTVKN